MDEVETGDSQLSPKGGKPRSRAFRDGQGAVSTWSNWRSPFCPAGLSLCPCLQIVAGLATGFSHRPVDPLKVLETGEFDHDFASFGSHVYLDSGTQVVGEQLF